MGRDVKRVAPQTSGGGVGDNFDNGGGLTVAAVNALIDAKLASSPVLGGFFPSAPTPPSTDDGTALATTHFVKLSYAQLSGALFTGDVRGLTPAPGDNDTSFATTAFVQAAIALIAGGANTSLSNLGVVAFNANLVPDITDTRNIGSSSKRILGLFLAGSTGFVQFGPSVNSRMGYSVGSGPVWGGGSAVLTHNIGAMSTPRIATWQDTDGIVALLSNLTEFASTSLSNLIPTGVNVDLVPIGDNAQSLGSSVKRWSDLFLFDRLNMDTGTIFNWQTGLRQNLQSYTDGTGPTWRDGTALNTATFQFRNLTANTLYIFPDNPTAPLNNTVMVSQSGTFIFEAGTIFPTAGGGLVLPPAGAVGFVLFSINGSTRKFAIYNP